MISVFQKQSIAILNLPVRVVQPSWRPAQTLQAQKCLAQRLQSNRYSARRLTSRGKEYMIFLCCDYTHELYLHRTYRSARTSISVFYFYGYNLMESLWSGQSLLREMWCCARGGWMMAVLTGLQEIHGTSFYYCLSVPHILGILS